MGENAWRGLRKASVTGDRYAETRMRGCQFTTAPQANRTNRKSKAPEVGPSRAFKEQEEGSVVGGEGNKGTPPHVTSFYR